MLQGALQIVDCDSQRASVRSPGIRAKEQYQVASRVPLKTEELGNANYCRLLETISWNLIHGCVIHNSNHRKIK